MFPEAYLDRIATGAREPRSMLVIIPSSGSTPCSRWGRIAWCGKIPNSESIFSLCTWMWNLLPINLNYFLRLKINLQIPRVPIAVSVMFWSGTIVLPEQQGAWWATMHQQGLNTHRSCSTTGLAREDPDYDWRHGLQHGRVFIVAIQRFIFHVELPLAKERYLRSTRSAE